MDELSELEQRIKHKIAQTKDEMQKTRERAVTDRLYPDRDIELGMNEILVLCREEEGFYRKPQNLPENEFVNFYFSAFCNFKSIILVSYMVPLSHKHIVQCATVGRYAARRGRPWISK
jgi:hypothetical protein